MIMASSYLLFRARLMAVALPFVLCLPQIHTFEYNLAVKQGKKFFDRMRRPLPRPPKVTLALTTCSDMAENGHCQNLLP